MALGLELRADNAIVLDDAVVDEPDATAGVRMRMGVSLSRRPVRRPTGMGYADRALSLAFVGPLGADFVR